MVTDHTLECNPPLLHAKPVPRVFVKRKGFEVLAVDLWNGLERRTRADSATEARRFAAGIDRISGWQPFAEVGTVVDRAVLEHDAAFHAQRKRRFGTCFPHGAP